MFRKINSRRHFIYAVLAWAAFAYLTSLPARAQNPLAGTKQTDTASAEKAEQILLDALKALGGDSYLNVRTVVGRGYYTLYSGGQSGLPLSFVDYIVYPDKERTEFSGQGTKTIQTNTGETGWVYDGESKTLRDMKPPQIADFKQALRTSVDNLLRGAWRKEGATLNYIGRREAGLAKRNLAVRLTYKDGFTIEFEFGAQDHLPAKIIYQKPNPENDTEEITEEDRLAQYVEIGGIFVPFVIDHYRAGQQASRINYKSVEFNTPIADTLFTRPENAKAVK